MDTERAKASFRSFFTKRDDVDEREQNRQAARRPQDANPRNTIGGITMTIGMVLMIIAAVLFGLAAFGVAFGSVLLVPLGLCLFALGHVIG